MKLQSFGWFFLFFLLPVNSWGGFSIKARYGVLPSAGGTALTDVQIARHANLARCLCDQWSEENDPYSYYFDMQYSGTFDNTDVYFYIGNDCANTSVALTQCSEIGALNINTFQNQTQLIPVPVNHLVDPGNGMCKAQASSSTFYIFSNLEQRTVAFSQSVTYDTKAPSAPQNVKAKGGESAITVSWDAALTEDGIDRFNVLCAVDGAPAEVSNAETATWVDSVDVCGKVLTLGSDQEGEDCPMDALIAGQRAHKCYVCGTAPATATSVRITGLTNGTEYSVAVVAIDKYDNPSVLSDVVTATPVPTIDFAEHYHTSGGEAKGDYCFIATAIYGNRDHPFVLLLRVFRDVALLTHAPGRAFVRWYYRNGPTWAQSIEQRPYVRILLQVLFFPFIVLVAIILTFPLWGSAILFLWFIRRHVRQEEVPHA